jgi:hypothetical protein
VAADEHRGAGEVRAQREHLAHVRVGRARLGVQVVAVVPDDDQPQVVHGAKAVAGCRRPPDAAAQDRSQRR